MKKILIVGTFFSLLSVSAHGQEKPHTNNDWKTTFASDSTFVQCKLLFDSLMLGLSTFKYDKTQKNLEAIWQQQHLSTDSLQQKYESADFKNAKEYEDLVNHIVLLRDTLEQKYPMFKQLPIAEKVEFFKYVPTEAEKRRIKAAERQRFPIKRRTRKGF